MTTKKTPPKAVAIKKNPVAKKAFKRTEIIISEVENGFEVGVKWTFNKDTNSAECEDNFRDYVAKTEEEALELTSKLVPMLVEDDEPVDGDE